MPRHRVTEHSVTFRTAVVLVAMVVALGALWAWRTTSDSPGPVPRSHASTSASSPVTATQKSASGSVRPAAAPAGTGRVKVVVLDPGHSADRAAMIDPATGLIDRYYPNYPEMNDVFAVALLVKQQLEAHGGFRVLLTKQTAGQDATYRQRADVANDSHADLGVSIHDQGGLPSQGGLPFATQNNLVYEQDVGDYAQPRNSAAHDIGKRTIFTDARVAALSRKYAGIFLAQRSSAEGHSVRLAVGRSEPRDANDSDIWLVQLFSKVPWIYNEAGGFSPGTTHCGVDGSGRRIPIGACLSAKDERRYATGIADSIIAALG